jgi:hypothetical protein
MKIHVKEPLRLITIEVSNVVEKFYFFLFSIVILHDFDEIYTIAFATKND